MQENTKIIAVICKDLNDFEMWGRNRGFVASNFKNRKIYVDDTIYLGVYKPEHLCSFMIDNIIDAASAIQNPLYNEILNHAKSNLKDKTELKQDYTVKPPLGIKPKYLHDEARFTELRDAIKRSMDGYYYIDPEWITEYNELLENIVSRTMKKL